ncbi:hypothetical protein [Pseudoalteromonas sp. Of7M-16]|uniref:hypothetical protein n=1 Tax=Pseudoalteromonas sp. Of7M-16 TaxID=2917756 RepID=UPI001EF4CB16|nr:hypothetical protein [Pseudoalteromonas sp. Of7M-16]MCG7550509.1 hypothetical protein [Pseudoalteromonas sp. Of7M-16]
MKVPIILLVVFLDSCTSPSVYDLNETMDLIADTEASAPNSVRGVFQFEIKAGAKRGDVVYLNTQPDYRDRRNVTLVLSWYAVAKMTKKYGQRPDGLLNELGGHCFLQWLFLLSLILKTTTYNKIDLYSF